MKTGPLTLKYLQTQTDIPNIDLKPVHNLLGEDIPDIDETPVGRFRLMQALKYKFGPNYKNFKKARDVLDHYDRESKYVTTLRRIKGASHG